MSLNGTYGGGYSALGKYFEQLNCDCGYEKWSQYLINKLRELNAGEAGLDIGCGNGYFTRAMHRAGYFMRGMDLSPEMLSRAEEIAADEGADIEFLSGDITKLSLNFKPDFITAVNDCINYVPADKLLKTFSRVAGCLKRGGIFIFDISSEHKLRHILGDNVFSEDGEDITWIWFNKLSGDRIEMDITLFSRRKDGAYDRFDERQTQYIHTEADVLNALSLAGFDAVSEGHLGGDKRERINFICKRR